MIAPAKVDVIVAGAGPAGIAAAEEASKAGLTVLIIDEQATAGGQVWRNAKAILEKGGPLAQSYDGAADALTGLVGPRITHAAGATLISADLDDKTVDVTWLARDDADSRSMIETKTRALIIATGAQERAIAFPGARLPGVMGVGAIQTAMKQSGLVPDGGKRDGKAGGVVLAGQGPLLLLTLTQIVALGGEVDAVLNLGNPHAWRRALTRLPGAIRGDMAILLRGVGLLRQMRSSKVQIFDNISELNAEGGDRIERVVFRSGGEDYELPCALLGVHDGVIANTQLTRLLRLEHHWDHAQQGFVPTLDAMGKASGVPVWVAGDAAGIEGAKAAPLRGRLAALSVAQALHTLDTNHLSRTIHPLVQKLERYAKARRFIEALYPPLPVDAFSDEETRLCRCEAVTFGDIRTAINSGAHGPNQVKTFTRCGMGPCQGRMCGNGLTRLIAMELGQTPDEVGALRIRPPLKPVLVRDNIASGDAAE